MAHKGGGKKGGKKKGGGTAPNRPDSNVAPTGPPGTKKAGSQVRGSTGYLGR